MGLGLVAGNVAGEYPGAQQLPPIDFFQSPQNQIPGNAQYYDPSVFFSVSEAGATPFFASVGSESGAGSAFGYGGTGTGPPGGFFGAAIGLAGGPGLSGLASSIAGSAGISPTPYIGGAQSWLGWLFGANTYGGLVLPPYGPVYPIVQAFDFAHGNVNSWLGAIGTGFFGTGAGGQPIPASPPTSPFKQSHGRPLFQTPQSEIRQGWVHGFGSNVYNSLMPYQFGTPSFTDQSGNWLTDKSTGSSGPGFYPFGPGRSFPPGFSTPSIDRPDQWWKQEIPGGDNPLSEEGIGGFSIWAPDF